MGKPGQPTDDLILHTLQKRAGMMTYVVCNILRQRPFADEPKRPAFPLIDTAYVRRRLMAMEKAGKVRRMPTKYMAQICWGAVPASDPTTRREREG